MVPAAGVEPATFRSGGERSNPLSYAGNGVCRKDNTLSADSQIARIFEARRLESGVVRLARQGHKCPF